ncbi:MAG: MFS transporter [Verrucomicrobia bacterium]|nr:MFS transporter [Verrucomicrobiota bacterium]
MSQSLKNTSTFTALRNPIFRKIWFAGVLSGTCVAAHDCAATWVMSRLSPSALFLSLMSTVASLPFFLFTLPAGALADIVDRRKLLWIMNLWLAVAAGLLAIFGALGVLNPYIILICIFLIGIGFAFNAPAWTAIVPELVPDEELPSAATLGGLQLNISGILGPAIGGMLLPLIGANWVFTLNAICFFLVILAILQWKRKERPSKLPLENFFESFSTAIRYVRYTPGIQVVLARNVLFAFFIALIPALIPVVGLKELKLTAAGCGILFSSMGAGSVFGAIFVVPWVRAHLSSNMVIVVANLVIAAVYLLMAFVRDQTIFMIVAAAAGIGWTMSASELWVAAQRAMPSWSRGRMNATIIMVSQGAMALGGVVWGTAAATLGVYPTLIGGAVLLPISLILAIPLSINFTGDLEFDPASVTSFSHKLIQLPQPQDGPVAITYEFEVDRVREDDFMELMRQVRLIHLRNGAFSWRLHEDLTRFNIFRIEMMVPSWTQHVLQRDRMTKAEKNIIEQAKNLHIGEGRVQERIYLCVNKELVSHRRLAKRQWRLQKRPS